MKISKIRQNRTSLLAGKLTWLLYAVWYGHEPGHFAIILKGWRVTRVCAMGYSQTPSCVWEPRYGRFGQMMRAMGEKANRISIYKVGAVCISGTPTLRTFVGKQACILVPPMGSSESMKILFDGTEVTNSAPIYIDK